MKTLGIDLASQPQNTACCTITWGEDGRGRVVELEQREVKLDDEALLGRMLAPDIGVVAIDAPFGWPRPFIDALTQYRNTGDWPVDVDRRNLYLRTTDCVVADVTALPDEDGEELRAKVPLSVSTDKISIPAMRCAQILTEFKRLGGDATPVKEVYPDAALRQWRLLPREWDAKRVGYKGRGSEAARRRRDLALAVAKAVREIAPLDDDVDRCAKSDDLLDAFVCALVARAIHLRLTCPIPEEHQEIAQEEGWIHLPQRGSLTRFRRPR